MEVFRTERLIVRPWTHSPADVDRIYDTYSRWEVAQWLGAAPRVLVTRDEAEGAVDRWAARTDDRWGLGLWAVEVRETGVVAGSVLLVPMPPPEPAEPVDSVAQPEGAALPERAAPQEGAAPAQGAAPPDGAPAPELALSPRPAPAQERAPGPPLAEVGWHFHPDSWHKGYATEAARGALARGFAAGLAEIYAVLRPDNGPSAAVCRRLGMTALGRTSRWYGNELEVFRARR